MPTRSFTAGTNKSRGRPRGGGRRGVRARQCLAPTMCPNVGATHWVALGHSCRHARSGWDKQIARQGLRDGGRRGASPDEGEAVPRPYYVSQRRGDPLGRPRSFMPTRSFTAGTNKSRGRPRDGGRRGASPGEGEAVPRPYYVSQRRGDPLGRPRSFMPTRSFTAGTNKSRGMCLGAVGVAGRRRMRARQCLAPTARPRPRPSADGQCPRG